MIVFTYIHIMKKTYFLLLLLTIAFSCKKEDTPPLQEFFGEYSYEHTIIVYNLNLPDGAFSCGGVLDDSTHLDTCTESHAQLPTHQYDTIKGVSTLKIYPSKNSEKELLIVGVYGNILNNTDSTFYYKPDGMDSLFYLKDNTYFRYINNNIQEQNSVDLNQIIINTTRPLYGIPRTYTINGIATKIN